MNKIVIIVVIVLVIIGGYFLIKWNNQIDKLPNSQEMNQSQIEKQMLQPESSEVSADSQIIDEPSEVKTTQSGKNYEVKYDDSGYSPKELIIKVGDTITWKNESSSGMWIGSAMHPTHIVYSGTSLEEHCPDVQNTSFDQCKSGQPGELWQFTFNKKGIWRYHNHVKASHFGSVVVE
jgi:plastocyanin